MIEMKRWIHLSTDSQEIKSSESAQPKLKRTLESGHSYEGTTTFNSIEEYLDWCEEDELYED